MAAKVLVTEVLLQNHMQASLKAALVHVQTVLKAVVLRVEASHRVVMRRVAMHHVVARAKNLVTRVHNVAMTDRQMRAQVLVVAVVTACHVVHVVLHKSR
jgi:hypothetical protein